MKNLNKEECIKLLSKTLDDMSGSGISLIPCHLIKIHVSYGFKNLYYDENEHVNRYITTAGKVTPNEIKEALIQWEQNGWLKIINDFETSDEDEPCVKMLMFMGGGDFPPNWIRD